MAAPKKACRHDRISAGRHHETAKSPRPETQSTLRSKTPLCPPEPPWVNILHSFWRRSCRCAQQKSRRSIHRAAKAPPDKGLMHLQRGLKRLGMNELEIIKLLFTMGIKTTGLAPDEAARKIIVPIAQAIQSFRLGDLTKT